MSWMERLKGECTITTPTGAVFTPLWVGDKITGGKRIGVFEYPDVDGATTQDQGLKPFDWPLTLYFDGEDNDTQAWAYVSHYKEKGLWTVVHPLYGARKLQPVTFEIAAQPVESGNVTVVTTTWIEAKPQAAVSSVDAASALQFLIVQAGAESANAMDATVTTDGLDEIRAVQNAVNSSLAQIKAAVTWVDNASTIYSQAQALASGYVVDVLSIVGCIQQLLLTPGIIAGDISARMRGWSDLLEGVTQWDTSGQSFVVKNAVAVSEAFAVAILEAAAQEVTLYPFLTRSDAVAAMDTLAAMFTTATDRLDSGQSFFQALRLDVQYFSQSQTYATTARMIAIAQRHLLDKVLNLKAGKAFVLDRPRACLEIAITEYGADGWDDSLFDFFIQTNCLTGNSIAVLPAGTRVVIYG